MKFDRIWSMFEGVIYHNMKFFSQFSVTPTGKTINAMMLKFFTGTYMLLKVDCFEGFVIWSKIDRFTINNTSRCNL